MARRGSLADLQSKSGNTDDTGEASGDLASATSGDDNGGLGGGRDNNGAVVVAKKNMLVRLFVRRARYQGGTYQEWQTTAEVVMTGLVTVQGHSKVMVVGSVTV